MPRDARISWGTPLEEAYAHEKISDALEFDVAFAIMAANLIQHVTYVGFEPIIQLIGSRGPSPAGRTVADFMLHFGGKPYIVEVSKCEPNHFPSRKVNQFEVAKEARRRIKNFSYMQLGYSDTVELIETINEFNISPQAMLLFLAKHAAF